MFFLMGGDKKSRKADKNSRNSESTTHVRELFNAGRFPVVTTHEVEGSRIDSAGIFRFLGIPVRAGECAEIAGYGDAGAGRAGRRSKVMEKVFFQSPEGGEGIEFFVLEQTRINGADYLLVAEEEEGDCEALILKDVSQAKGEEAMYEMVESEEELEYLSRIFGEILDDVDFAM